MFGQPCRRRSTAPSLRIRSNYARGIYSTTAGDATGYCTLPASTVSPGDSLIPAQYDAITEQIIVSNVSAGSGGFISARRRNHEHRHVREINVNSDLGQVTIDNQTSYPIVVNNVSASKSTTSTSLTGVDIIDTNQPRPLNKRCTSTSRAMSSTSIRARPARPSSSWNRARRSRDPGELDELLPRSRAALAVAVADDHATVIDQFPGRHYGRWSFDHRRCAGLTRERSVVLPNVTNGDIP